MDSQKNERPVKKSFIYYWHVICTFKMEMVNQLNGILLFIVS